MTFLDYLQTRPGASPERLVAPVGEFDIARGDALMRSAADRRGRRPKHQHAVEEGAVEGPVGCIRLIGLAATARAVHSLT